MVNRQACGGALVWSLREERVVSRGWRTGEGWRKGRVDSCAMLTLLGTMSAPDPHHELLDRLAGHWVMRGTIAGHKTTHDVDAKWILNKTYLQIHEVSRETGADKKPQYEAMVLVVWDPKENKYGCQWLDTTGYGVASFETPGRANPDGDTMAFVFNYPDGRFHNTFAYDRSKAVWTWNLDNESDGKLEPFARLTLTRK